MSKVTVTIVWDQLTKQTHVSGPFGEEIVCLGMLEQAKQVVLDHNKDKKNVSQSPIVIPKTGGGDSQGGH